MARVGDVDADLDDVGDVGDVGDGDDVDGETR